MVSTINELEENQNEESNIKLLAAQRTLYNKARFYQVIIFFIPILLPVILSIVKLYYNNNIIDFSLNILNICSIAIYMLIYNKIDKLKEYAAIIQQKFDKNVYNIDLSIDLDNFKLNNIIEENYKKIFKSKKEKERLYNWYTFNKNSNIREYDIILFCQKTNVSWSEMLKEKYIKILLAFLWGLIIIFSIIICFMAYYKHENSKIVIETICSLSPIFIFTYINYSNIKTELNLLNNINTNINNLLYKENEQNMDKFNNILKIQNNIFEYRKKSILIFNIFYNFFRTNFENTTKNYE